MATRDGRQARWDAHNRERRTKILDAAVAVIEEGAPGEEFHVHQIAEKAGLNRTVVYRHFADRADLDEAIRKHIVEIFVEILTPAVTLDGTINEVIRRIIATYVDWTCAHPALHAVALQDSSGAFAVGIERIAGLLTDILELAIAMLGAELREGDEAMVEPLAYGLIGAVLATVQRWASRGERVPDADVVTELLSQSVWNLLEGHVRRLGLELDPDLPITEALGLDAVAAALSEPTP